MTEMNSRNSKSWSRRDFLRGLATAAGAAAVLPLLEACTPAATPTPAVSAPQATQPPAAAPASLRLWTFNDPGWVKASTDLIKLFAADSPNITVKHEFFEYSNLIQTIQTSMAAKNEADIIEMFGTWVQNYAKGNTILPVPEGVIALSEMQNLFYKAPLDGFVYNGKLYGFPHEFNLENGGVLVNKKMFQDAGLTYPPAWKSWEELIADAKKLVVTDGTTMSRAGFDFLNDDGIAFWLWEGILERGAEYFADDKIHLNLLSPQAQDSVQFMVDLCQVHKVVDPNLFNSTIADAQAVFFQGLCAIAFRGPWVVPGGRVNYPKFSDPWDYVSIPPLYGSQYNFAADSGWGLVVSPNSKAPDAAWQFCKYTTTKKETSRVWNVDSGTVPAMKAVAEDPSLLNDENWLGPSLKVLPFGRFIGNLQDRDFIWYNIVRDTVYKILQGKMDVKAGMASMNKDANDRIDSVLKGS
jgi:multiple sugar transport system substrate-binding protein